MPCGAKVVSKRMGKGTKLNMPPMSVLMLKGASWLSDVGTEDEVVDKAAQTAQE
jgi:hypothetical protein